MKCTQLTGVCTYLTLVEVKQKTISVDLEWSFEGSELKDSVSKLVFNNAEHQRCDL